MELVRKVVSLEGNIAAGKSHLTAALDRLLGAGVLTCAEPVLQPLMKLFYGDVQQYGFAVQLVMQRERKYQANLAYLFHKYEQGEEVLFVWDRSVLGDYCFALWNHLCGGIKSDQMRAYEDMAGGSLNDILKIEGVSEMNRILLLDDEPAHCKKRCEEVRCNPEEHGIPLAYYEGLDDMHFAIFVKLFELIPGRVEVMQWNTYENAQTVVDSLETTPTAKVIQHSGGLPEGRPSTSVVLQNQKQINEAYRNSRLHLTGITHLYIPRNVMTIAPETKITRLDHRYTGLQFYENAYKRVVMRYLAAGCTVTMFNT